MPYRRLPNTDQARVRALKAAVEKGEMYNVRDLAITLKTLFEARNFSYIGSRLRKFIIHSVTTTSRVPAVSIR